MLRSGSAVCDFLAIALFKSNSLPNFVKTAAETRTKVLLDQGVLCRLYSILPVELYLSFSEINK